MSNDLIKLERARAIPDSAITETDLGYEIESSDPRNQGEVNYFVSFPAIYPNGHCTCRDFEFRNTEQDPNYVCKHIIKITEYRLKRLVK